MRNIACALAILCVPIMAAESSSASPTFYKDILPVLQTNCQSCHRPGQIAPMSLLDYKSARPWAKAMKAAVLSKKMPPWFAGPNSSAHFVNDRTLSEKARQMIATWADTGAPEGDSKDGPAPVQWPAEGWTMGKPEKTFDLGSDFKIPAQGTIEYTYFVLPTGFTEDRWLTGIEIKPGNTSAVHHVVLWVRPKGLPWLSEAKPLTPFVPKGGFQEGSGGNVGGDGARPPQDDKGVLSVFPGQEMIATYFPGSQPYIARPGQARLVPAGADLIIQMHYTATGAETVDRTRVGLLFAKETPKERVIHTFVGNTTLRIPPGDPNHRVDAHVVLQREIALSSLQPHLHLRGKALSLDVTYPNGKNEMLLDVPKYDFNWQISYDLEQPIVLPKGTEMHLTVYFDNSPNNKFNPDPAKEVFWGDQSWDEMASSFVDIAFPVGVDPMTIAPPRSRTPNETASVSR